MRGILRIGLGMGVLAALLALGACGVGGGGAIAAASGGGGGGGGGFQRRPPPPRVDLTAPSSDPANGYISFQYVLVDKQVKTDLPGDDPNAPGRPGGTDDPRVQVFPEFALERTDIVGPDGTLQRGFGPWQPMTGSEIVGSDGTRALQLGDHTFVWNTLVDVPSTATPLTGRVRARVRAEYEETAGITRTFRAREVTFRIDNRLAATIFGGDVFDQPDIDTFPVDLQRNGNDLLVACAGAGIVESVEATGRTLRVIGIGVPGVSGDGGNPGVAQLANVRAVGIDPMTGLIYTNHDTVIRVTNPSAMDQPVGVGIVPGRTIVTAIGANQGFMGARSARVHPSGALLFISTRNRIIAFNTNPAGDVELAGVTIQPGDTATIAGGGSTSADGAAATDTIVTAATSLAIGPDGEIYYGERDIGRVRVINPGTTPLVLPIGTVQPGTVMTVAGTGVLGLSGDGGPATSAQLNQQDSIDCDGDRNLVIADTFNIRVRLVNLGVGDTTLAGTTVSPGMIDTIAGGGGGGVGSRARDLRFLIPNAVVFGVDQTVLVADQRRVIMVNGADSTVTAYGVTAQGGRTALVYDANRRSGLPLGRPLAVHAPTSNEVFLTDRSTVRVLNLRTNDEVYGGAAVAPGEVAVVAGGAVPGFSGDRSVNPAGGFARSAAFDNPAALVTDGPFRLYIADTGNDRVRYVNIGDLATTGEQAAFGKALLPGFVDTIVGGGAPAADDGDGLPPAFANLSGPQGLAVFDGLLFIADTGNHRIRCVNGSPQDEVVAGVTVFAGTIRTIYGGGVPGLSPDGPGPWLTDSPTAMAVDSRGILYFAETGNARIRMLNLGRTAEAQAGVTRSGVTVAANEVATLVGTGVRGNFGDGGGAPEALIDAPAGMVLQSLTDGTPVALYFADTPQHVVRMVNLTEFDVIVSLNANGSIATTLAGGGITSIAGGPNAFGAPNAPAFSGDGEEPLRMRFSGPAGIAITSFNGLPAHFLVADRDNDRLRRFGAPPIVISTSQ